MSLLKYSVFNLLTWCVEVILQRILAIKAIANIITPKYKVLYVIFMVSSIISWEELFGSKLSVKSPKMIAIDGYKSPLQNEKIIAKNTIILSLLVANWNNWMNEALATLIVCFMVEFS